MEIKIIEGSQEWLEKVPDEYAIQCIEVKEEKNFDKILTFSYVTTKCPLKGCGYVQKYGKIKVTNNVESIIVYKNDLSTEPNVYFRAKFGFYHGGKLEECKAPDNILDELPVFAEKYHYSAKYFGKEKIDDNVPDWLKDFAVLHTANIAYFKF